MGIELGRQLPESEKVNRQEDLLTRGVLDIITKEGLLNRLAEEKPLRVKYGIDPTMPSAHIGHAVPLRKLKQFQELGHVAVIIIGDYTARIGDPTGKYSPRSTLSAEQVDRNAALYFDQAYRILDPDKVEIHKQSEWYSRMRLEEIMRIMSTVTYSKLMEHETFAQRVKQGRALTFQEMLYPVLQAYDSVMIGADVELGGIDQRFNFVLTRDLQRAFGQIPEEAVLMHYLPGIDGEEKMSKSLNNSIDLLEDSTNMYAKIMSIPDNLMEKYFELGTDLPMSTIKQLISRLRGNQIHPVTMKKILARTITGLYHSSDDVNKAEADFETRIQKKETPTDIPEITVIEASVDLINVLVDNNYLKSKSEGRRLMAQGGIHIQGQDVDITSANINIPEEGLTIRVGKRNYIRIKKAS